MSQQIPPQRLSLRTGMNAIELMAIWRLLREARAMPASVIVQMALWPDRISDWAAAEGIDSSVVYNMLAGTKPYRKTRLILAHRLGVDVEVVDALIDQQPVQNPTPNRHAPAGLRDFVELVIQGELFGSEQPELPLALLARARRPERPARTMRQGVRGQIPIEI